MHPELQKMTSGSPDLRILRPAECLPGGCDGVHQVLHYGQVFSSAKGEETGVSKGAIKLTSQTDADAVTWVRTDCSPRCKVCPKLIQKYSNAYYNTSLHILISFTISVRRRHKKNHQLFLIFIFKICRFLHRPNSK